MTQDLRDLAHLAIRFWQPIVAVAFLLVMVNVVAGTYRTPYMGSDMTMECRKPMYVNRMRLLLDEKQILRELESDDETK